MAIVCDKKIVTEINNSASGMILETSILRSHKSALGDDIETTSRNRGRCTNSTVSYDTLEEEEKKRNTRKIDILHGLFEFRALPHIPTKNSICKHESTTELNRK